MSVTYTKALAYCYPVDETECIAVSLSSPMIHLTDNVSRHDGQAGMTYHRTALRATRVPVAEAEADLADGMA